MGKIGKPDEVITSLEKLSRKQLMIHRAVTSTYLGEGVTVTAGTLNRWYHHFSDFRVWEPLPLEFWAKDHKFQVVIQPQTRCPIDQSEVRSDGQGQEKG